MKDRKIIKEFTYEAFGFPVLLINVPMKRRLGKWFVDINYYALERAVLGFLIKKPTPLSGSELRFIRKYLNMNTTDFGKILDVSHAAISKWENEKTPVPTPYDFYIRLYLLDHLNVKDSEFRNLYSNVSPASLAKNKDEEIGPISIKIDQALKTA